MQYEFVPGPADPTSVEMGLDEPLPHALRRITGNELDHVISGFADPDADFDTVIHTSRKSLKRIRGLLRLVRDEIGYEHYRNENVVLRDVGRRYGPVRDAHVLVLTLDHVTDHFQKQLASDAFGHTRSWLVDRYLDMRAEIIADRQLATSTVFTLKASKARFAGTTVMQRADGRPYIRDSFDAVAPGLERVYRRGRHGYRRCLEQTSVETLHAWRKRVKYLRYQLETLRPIGPELLGSQIQLLDDLGEILGHDHDLATLAELVESDISSCPNHRERELLLLMIDDLQVHALQRALGIASFMYEESGTSFVDRVAWHWNTARGEASD